MAEKSFLKGFCPKQNKYFGMMLEKQGSRWVVTDFYPMSKEEGKAAVSLVEQDHFETRSTLLPCAKENTRRICSSGRITCPQSGKYNFQCIYCNKLQISYDNDLSSSSYREGEVIRLSQGQEIKIQMGGRSLEEVELNVGWDPVRQGSFNMDVDSSIVLYSQGKGELVYFGDLRSSDGSVIHHGDNLTGERDDSIGKNDVDEIIDIKLNRVSRSFDKIAVVLNIYKALERRQDMTNIDNLFIRLFDKKTKKQLFSYQIGSGARNSNALVIGVFTRSGSGWTFKAVGRSHSVDHVTNLKNLVMNSY